MKKSHIFGIVLLGLTGAAIAQAPMPPALYADAEGIAQALAESAADRPSMAVSRVSNNDDYRINLIRRTEAAGAIVHEVGTELHFITEGSGTLVTGGVIDRSADGGRAMIIGGLARSVSEGDAILIPEGTPHQYSVIESSVTYLEVRF